MPCASARAIHTWLIGWPWRERRSWSWSISTRPSCTSVARSRSIPKQPRNVLALAAAQALVGDIDAARLGLAQLQRDQPHLSRETLVERFSKGGPNNAQIRRGMGLVLGETLQSTAAASTPPP